MFDFPSRMCASASMWHNSFALYFTGSHISSQDPSAMEKSELSVSPVDKVMAKINGKDLGQILIKRNNCWYKWCFQCIDIAGAEELSVEEHWSMYLTFASPFILCETSLKGLSLLSLASCSPCKVKWRSTRLFFHLKQFFHCCPVLKDRGNQRSH